ncbi:HAD family hydrolase [Pararoseomonas indoligenes]|uniref:phosphoglycolate phosphatase n=1 Tax=Roseomonas indoligenes TaxID=2820811 RepID=A0A940MXG8_9PROT|nr:HAD family hydrolase [Pararoseomonas indoligenes]MBP0492977.1 HAD family hydrolase [Pararoseomonas indoligenes]
MIRPSAIVWDWDNTLADGWPAIRAGLNAAFRDAGLPEWTLDEVKERVRKSLRDSFPAIFGDRWEHSRDIFYAAVRATHLEVLRPMPGVEETLRRAARIAPMAVLSNKGGSLLRAEAAHLGWSPLFRALVGAGDCAADKPDPTPMRVACAACGTTPNTAVWYVGDNALDMDAARRAGCLPVLLGDAAHDGGPAHASAALHFLTAAQMTDALSALDKAHADG